MTYDALNNMEDLTKSPLAVAASSLNSSDLLLFNNNVTKYAHNVATVIAIVTENVIPNANDDLISLGPNYWAKQIVTPCDDEEMRNFSCKEDENLGVTTHRIWKGG
eukprot:scaffold7287_cov138-Skeletonema_menzelii.AAC.2